MGKPAASFKKPKIKEGIRAIVQPGGSLRDFEAIEACNEADPQVTMVFTSQRAFKH